MHDVLPFPPHHAPLALTHVRTFARLTAGGFAAVWGRLSRWYVHLR